MVGEIDTPGHAASWCAGMPELCPEPTGSCAQPLDPSINATFDTIEAVLRDVTSVLDDDFIHLGGDEAATACWLSTPRIAAWLEKQGNWSGDDAYKYFVGRTTGIAKKLGKQAIVWDEGARALVSLFCFFFFSLSLSLSLSLSFALTHTHTHTLSLSLSLSLPLEVWNHYGTSLDKANVVINTRFRPSQGPSRPACVHNATAHGYG